MYLRNGIARSTSRIGCSFYSAHTYVHARRRWVMCQYRELFNCNEDAVYVGFDRHGQSRYLYARKS